MTPVKILYLTRAYGEHAGGMERLSFELARELARQPSTDVTVIAHHGSRSMSPLHNFLCLPAAFRAAWTADVILLGDPMLAFAGWLLRRITRKPVAVIVHGLDITYPKRWYQWYLTVFARRFQLYLPISTHTNTILERLLVTGRREIIHPGVDDRIYAPHIPRQELIKLLGQKEPILVIATVGRLVTRKGHAWFISNIVPRIAAKIHYVIAGDGPANPEIRAAMHAAGVANRVHLLGRVSDQTRATLLNTINAFVQPNILSEQDVEGFGLVLLEAALCQRPVIAAESGGISDAIHDGKNGLLLPAEDTVAWIDTINRLAAGNLPLPADPRAYTNKTFNWPQQAVRYRQALGSIAAIHPSQRRKPPQ